MTNFLRCSNCKGHLQVEKDFLLCDKCKTPYLVREGIPDMIPPLIEKDLKKMVDFWNNYNYDYDGLIENTPKKRLKAIDQPLLHQCTRGGRVLEVGCGTARLKKEVEKMGGTYIGLDPSFKLLKQGLDKYGNEKNYLIRGVGEHLPFPDNYFDTIIGGYYAFRYIKLEEAYPECARVLKPGGILAFDLLNYWQSKMVALALNIKNRRFPRNLRNKYTCNDVLWANKEANKLQKFGFKVISILSTKKLPIRDISFIDGILGWEGYWKGNLGALIGNDVIFICENMKSS